MFRIVPYCVLALLLLESGIAKQPLPELSVDQKEPLLEYLRSHGQSPLDYIAGKFEDHDVVFVGEYHRVRHDVQLIQDLIPRLYDVGVYNLGIEFGCYEYQDTVDYLLTAPAYDESLARWLMFKSSSDWGYVEYEDLYRRAWKLNQALAPDKPRFRILNLNYRVRWDLATEEMTREERRRVFHKGSSDEHMARVVLDEFVKKGLKALVYSGNHHGFTRYRQPIYNEKTGEFYRFEQRRMGNIVNDSIPNRVFCVMLHRAWPQRSDINIDAYPAGGVIDAVMPEFPDGPVGFDVVGSPFGGLIDTMAYYSVGYKGFRLADYCDGYVFQRPFSEYEGCRVDTLFVTEANFREAVDFIPNIAARAHFKTPQDFIENMRRDNDFGRRFAHLH